MLIYKYLNLIYFRKKESRFATICKKCKNIIAHILTTPCGLIRQQIKRDASYPFVVQFFSMLSQKFSHILVNKKYYKSPFQYVSIVTFQATKIGRVLFTVLSEKLSLLQSLTMKLLSRLLWRSSDEPVTKAFLFLGTGFT